MICLSAVQLADPPKWTDVVTAVGTLSAAVAAVFAIGATLWLARRDRSAAEELRQADLAQAAQDRAEADQRLRDEREASDQRLRDERADADRRQVRDWQAAAAVNLLERIAGVQPHLERIAAGRPAFRDASEVGDSSRRDAVLALQQGAYTDALALGCANGTVLYRTLVSLVVSTPIVLDEISKAEGSTPGLREKVAETAALNIRRYARYVRLQLCRLIETGDIPDSAVGQDARSVDAPVVAISAVMWTPVETPDDWFQDTNTDSKDPQFTLHSLKR